MNIDKKTIEEVQQIVELNILIALLLKKGIISEEEFKVNILEAFNQIELTEDEKKELLKKYNI